MHPRKIFHFAFFPLVAILIFSHFASAYLEKPKEVEKICPIDISRERCCDSNWGPDAGKCCPYSWDTHIYKSDPECARKETSCRYSDTGELDVDCCMHVAVQQGDDCCQAVPEVCKPEQTVQNPSRSLLSTDEGREAYDSDYNALVQGEITPATVDRGPSRQIISDLKNQEEYCRQQCEELNPPQEVVSQPSCANVFPGCTCRSYYQQCLNSCTIRGSMISCPSILRNCPSIISGCTQTTEMSDNTGAVNSCISQSCSQYSTKIDDANLASSYAASDYQQEKELKAQQEEAQNMPDLPPPGPQTRKFSEQKARTEPKPAENLSDADGNPIYMNDIRGGLTGDMPYAKINTPIGDVGEGEAIDIPMQPGFIPEEAIFTTSKPLQGGEVIIEGSLPTPLWNAEPKKVFSDGLPPPDGKVMQYFKVTTKSRDTNSLEDVEEAEAYKYALFKWALPNDFVRQYTPRTLQYTSNGWSEVPTELSWCDSGSKVCYYVSDPEGAGIYAIVLDNRTSPKVDIGGEVTNIWTHLTQNATANISQKKNGSTNPVSPKNKTPVAPCPLAILLLALPLIAVIKKEF